MLQNENHEALFSIYSIFYNITGNNMTVICHSSSEDRKTLIKACFTLHT